MKFLFKFRKLVSIFIFKKHNQSLNAVLKRALALCLLILWVHNKCKKIFYYESLQNFPLENYN